MTLYKKKMGSPGSPKRHLLADEEAYSQDGNSSSDNEVCEKTTRMVDDNRNNIYTSVITTDTSYNHDNSYSAIN